MKKYWALGIILLLLSTGCENKIENSEAANYISDDLYKRLDIEISPKKIVSLAPNLTELLFELGVGNKIIGNTSYCNFPDSAKNIPKVADLLTVNLEIIVALQPDLIFITAEGNSKSEYEKLVNLGFKVFVSNPRDYKGIKKTMLDMGKIFKLNLLEMEQKMSQ